ncbi:MAG: YraN family protein [Bacteroides sp.]|nr:YraN family protein [Bacteroides sp.]MCM1095924.1 YraN family protein [Terasakiella sp.]
MAKHNNLGTWGESLACERLVADGYAIAARNWRSGHYEIDIVAMKGDHVIFCEVKTRSEGGADPLDAVDSRKITRMIASARAYMEMEGLERHTVQFDLFGITAAADGTARVEHIPDAFEIPLSAR